jgi:hypothetical protein
MLPTNSLLLPMLLLELPSILMPDAGDNQFENLQLNPVDLVDEVEKEVLEEAASDPDGHAALAAAVVDAAALPSPESFLRSHVSSSDAPQRPVLLPLELVHPQTQRRPVVPFVKVRKLSDAEGLAKKRHATSAEGGSLTKKPKSESIDAVATIATAENMPTPRMTRSRMKKAGPDAMAEGLAAKTRAKKGSPVKASDGQAVARSKALKPEPMISDSGSVSGSVTSATDIIKEATESESAKAAMEVPMVTPVESEEITHAKHLVVANKVKHATLPLPKLPSNARSSDQSTSQNGNAAALKAAAAALKESPRKGTGSSKKAPAKNIATKAAASCTKVSKAIPLPTFTIDTSSAHIQALIGENGASVCESVRTCIMLESEEETSSYSGTNALAKNNGAGSPLTQEQRAKQSRDRNRKHARNTRLRKKAYVEELKQTLNELVAQRDRSEVVQEQNRQRELEQREVRFRVMEEFLKLRGRNVAETERWSAILMPPFTLTMPITSSFQEIVGTSSDGKQQKLVGVEDVMQDSRHFAAFLQTLSKSDASDTNLVSLVYQCDRDDFMMDGCMAVLDWKATSVGAGSRVG